MLGVEASQEEIAALSEQLGIDQPLLVQFGRYLARLAHGDFGMSIYHKMPVTKLFMMRLPNTLRLAGFAVIFALSVAIPLGVTAAVKRNSIWDYLSMLIALAGMSVPVFWLGILFVYVFGFQLCWLPISGIGDSWYTLDGFCHTILPGIALSAGLLASSTRLLRSSMLEILSEDYIRTARAKGIREGVVVYRHALRNALNPLVTNIALQMGALIGGAFLTETVFAWPGIGRLLVQAILRRDYPLVQGITLATALFVILINLVADLCYTLLDPKVRY
jgi:peptide/nickel transport system permease protein